MRFIIVLFISFVGFSSCENSSSSSSSSSSFKEEVLRSQMIATPGSQAEKEKNQILDYAIKNQLQVQATPSGVYYILEKEGSGEAFDKESIATIHYTCRRLKDDFETTSTRKDNRPYAYSKESNLIAGLKEAIPMLKQGGKGTFIIPSALAHGRMGAGNFYPPNTVLIYELEVIKLEKRKSQEKRQNTKDQKLIEAYLAKKKWSTQKTEEGIHYLIEKEGKGNHPSQSAKVKIKYTLSFLDDFMSKSGEDKIDLGNAMIFWKKTVPLLKKGGTGTFVIPSYLAFGNREVGDIPANSNLVLNCELLEIE